MIGTTVYTYPEKDENTHKKSMQMWLDRMNKVGDIEECPTAGIFENREKYNGRLQRWLWNQESERKQFDMWHTVIRMTEETAHKALRLPALVVACDSEGMLVEMEGKLLSRKAHEIDLMAPPVQSKEPQ